MAQTVASHSQSPEIQSSRAVRPDFRASDPAVALSRTPLRRVIADTLRAEGNLKATAADMDIDRAQLYRQLENGKLTIERLEALGPQFCADLGRELLDRFSPLMTPRARAQQVIRDVRAGLDELSQLVEHFQ